MLESFSFSCLSFSFFESSLGSKGINFSLSISSFFLELSESLDFSFFLILYSLSLKLSFIFFLILSSLISNNTAFLICCFLGSLFFFNKRLSIGFGSLFHEHVNSLSLIFSSFLIFTFHSLYVGQKLESFFISNFLLLHSLNGSFLNLIDDNLSSLLSSNSFSGLSLFFFLEDLESFNFHH